MRGGLPFSDRDRDRWTHRGSNLGLRRLQKDHRIHVIGPRASNPSTASWVVPYRTDAIHAHDIIARTDGVRVTSLARTAFDLARWLAPDDLLSVIEQATHDGRLSDEELREVALDWLSPRRPWARKYIDQIDRRFAGGAAESHPEVRVAEALRRAGVRGLVRQHRVDLSGHGRARFDLAVVDLKWAVEVDVHPSHDETMGRDRDHRRDIAASLDGWLVTRISRADYEEAFDQSIASVADQYHSIIRSHRRPA
jgi:very-short-patch-repair endonuclease